MRLSILIACLNEGDLLWKTVEACRATCGDLDYEIVVADDGSTDGSLDALRRRFPEIRIQQSPVRRGVAACKDLAAEHARGDVLLFLDAHCKPEPNAVRRLVESVEELDGEAVIMPSIAHLDAATWENDLGQLGHGYTADLNTFTWRWLGLPEMQAKGAFYESPTIIGCVAAVSKALYQRVWGFDREMFVWGVEDVDFGVKAWRYGAGVLHDPRPIVGHRFQGAFSTYTVPNEFVTANRLRMARKMFSNEHWSVWLDQFRAQHEHGHWDRAWELFCARRGSVEMERAYLRKAPRDGAWWIEKFHPGWPTSIAAAEVA